MMARYRGDGCSAEMAERQDGCMLTLRDGKGRIYRRRHYPTIEDARREMWRHSSRWRAV